MLTLIFPAPAVHVLVSLAAAAALLLLSVKEGDPRRTGKVKLNMTARARRLFVAACACFVLLAALAGAVFPLLPQALLWLLLIVLVQLMPLCCLAAAAALEPGEQRLQQRYFREAVARMARVKPVTIGITGSYGKTSVKNMLGEVLLACKGAAFWPPKGTNTIMGNTRAIREGLRDTHEYAVIEMGTYRQGTIERVCELAPPQIAIITAIASMHMERFGSREAIYQAKTELARALPENGVLICNGDDDFARRACREFPRGRNVLYGFSDDADYRIFRHTSSAEGTSFTISRRGEAHEGFTALLGKPALSNIAAVFAAACELGCDTELVLGAIRNVKPVENRLSIQKAGGAIFLNDAYNSNPVGFAAALDVLAEMPGTRRILVTPGMVELGADQAEENRRAGSHAGKICGLAIVVGEVNRDALRRGLIEGGLPEKDILCFTHRDQAFAELKRLQRDGDVVLIENDLTDWYEDVVHF